MSMLNKLSKCKNCNGIGRILSTSQVMKGEYWIECMTCGYATEKYLLENMAIRQWNKGNIKFFGMN